MAFFVPFLIEDTDTDDKILFACPPKRSCIAPADRNISCSQSITTQCPVSVAEQSNEMKIGGLSVDSRDEECVSETTSSTQHLEIYFVCDSPLCPEELLMYSLMTIQFKTCTFTKHHSMSLYKPIAQVISKVCGVQFDANSIRRFFPRIANNELKSTIGKQYGKVRWRYFKPHVEEFIRVSGKYLECLLKSPDTMHENVVVATSEQLKRVCCIDTIESERLSLENFVNQFNNVIRKHLSHASSWIPWFNFETTEIHLFSFGPSPGYAEKEIRLPRTFEWKLYLNAIERDTSKCELFENVPKNLGTVKLLVQLLEIIDNHTTCDGSADPENFHLLIKDLGDNIYKTKDGKNAVSIENNKIRSTNCHLFTPKGITQCQACKKCHHYLRTLLSRRKAENTTLHPEKGRLDYKSKPELLSIARKSSMTLKVLKTKNKRLELSVENMVEVGPNSNSDLRRMFNDLYTSLQENRNKQKSPVCLWENCAKTIAFEDVEELYRHCKTHIERLDTRNVAPIDRCYTCKWQGCTKYYSKLKLVENHLREHTGNMNDEFLEILLSDQAKALTTESRQMRWHPAVIRWCLRIYLRSHKLYDDLRNSGGLKLPSGRTLSDYNNFCSPQTGWKTENLRIMKEQFDKKNAPKHGKLGGLFFDEMKIKEGLVFDTKNWELVGFTDLLQNNVLDTVTDKSDAGDNLASHVLQFFFRSTFFNFDFPCAFFLTRNTTALQLNRLFWLGISILHTYGFEVILCCCDGASSNRSFIEFNTGDSNKCSCFNPFSGKEMFFFSDPPHLIKKLRNNLYSSGHKSEHTRYTRTLFFKDNYILWNHIYAVYQRESRRHLYVTDLRKAHVTIDSISKMRVKLAVQTLSHKVVKEMEECDKEATKETRKYIQICETFWEIFNNPAPMKTPEDKRILQLNEVLDYFNTWEKWLAQRYHTKSEQAKHFISWQTISDLKVRINIKYNSVPTIKHVSFIIICLLEQDASSDASCLLPPAHNPLPNLSRPSVIGHLHHDT